MFFVGENACLQAANGCDTNNVRENKGMWIMSGYRSRKCQIQVIHRMTCSFLFVSGEVSCVIPLSFSYVPFNEFGP